MPDHLQRQYMQDQIQEINRYLIKCQEESLNHVILRWIELYAATYRKHWEAEHPS